jgi:hypothetical protein
VAVAVSCVVPPIFTVGWAGAIASEVNDCAWPAEAWKTPASSTKQAKAANRLRLGKEFFTKADLTQETLTSLDTLLL